ncbi:TetR/AcrR family transcriptional regulator C-terminal domain-containing protein [Floricoccus penangensis]|uniref:TetR/AcrR family transcriptional regulator C-terminal domain-containing protein n=1 Tax=Floricoccus penangensis TaxID=1859475 RepID=UPI00203EE28A|nr:TetR/AcrR family transcriptional regulator C-terminal domain-containing protein [Floricoccus penangensis]URZ88133.1 TetR/AcrR family transcriptional regulator C-terminal domain-containing protein [Floricoccus penangensis]
MNIDKATITKRKIKRALLDCMEGKKFDLITVNDIVTKASVNRSTFYRYYDDKYALLDEIELTVIKHINQYRDSNAIYIEGKGYINSQNIISMLRHLKKFDFIINRLLSFNGDQLFEVRLRNQLSQQFYKSIKVTTSNEKLELIKDFLGHIVIGTFRYWTSKDENMSEEDLSQVIEDLLTSGFMKAVENAQEN